MVDDYRRAGVGAERRHKSLSYLADVHSAFVHPTVYKNLGGSTLMIQRFEQFVKNTKPDLP